MDTIPTEERRLYEISYTTQGTEEEKENVPRDLRDIVEKQGSMVQDAQPPKKYRGFSLGFIHIIASPSLASRIEAAMRALPSSALKQTLMVRWGKTAPQLRGRHAFMRKPSVLQPESQKEKEKERAIEIDKQLDELLEKQL